MSETLTLPVLPLDDDVVLPGMVVPIELTDNEVRGAIDAARNSKGLGRGPGIRTEEKAQVLIVPRIGDRGLAGTRTLSVGEQGGRGPGGWRAPARLPWSSRSDGCPVASLARCCAACRGSASATGPQGPVPRCGSRALSLKR